MRIEPLSDGFGSIIYPETIGESIASIDHDWLKAALKDPSSGGLLLFRGFDADCDRFLRFTESGGTRFLVHHNGEGRNYVDGDPTFATVAKSNKPIDFHLEMASNPIKPDVLWFLCEAPSLWRGRIGFADGRAVLKGLTQRTRKLIEEKGFLYRFDSIPFSIWNPSVKALIGAKAENLDLVRRLLRRNGHRFGVSNAVISADGTLSMEYRVAPIYVAPFCGEEVLACGLLDNPNRTLFGDGMAVDRASYLEVAQSTYQNSVWLDWQAGDVAVVDNTRVMHAREAFEDDQRRVLIRYSNLDS
jgi:hypothetical protein